MQSLPCDLDPNCVVGGGGGWGGAGGGGNQWSGYTGNVIGGGGVIGTIQQTINTARTVTPTSNAVSCNCPNDIDAPCTCPEGTNVTHIPFNTPVAQSAAAGFDLSSLFARASNWVKANPIPSLAIGVGVGYLITKGGK